MSLPKKLVTVTPVSLTLLILITVLIILGVFLLRRELSEHSRSYSASRKLSPTPKSIYEAGYGTFKGKCPKYGFVKRGVVQDDGSTLSELDAEITNIFKGGWALSAGKEYTTLVPDKNTDYPGRKIFQIGDCVIVTYAITKSGKSVVTQVAAQ